MATPTIKHAMFLFHIYLTFKERQHFDSKVGRFKNKLQTNNIENIIIYITRLLGIDRLLLVELTGCKEKRLLNEKNKQQKIP